MTAEPDNAGDEPQAATNWTGWHTFWTLLWFAALAGILFGFMSKSPGLTLLSTIASLFPPLVLVWLEWRAKKAKERRRVAAAAASPPRVEESGATPRP